MCVFEASGLLMCHTCRSTKRRNSIYRENIEIMHYLSTVEMEETRAESKLYLFLCSLFPLRWRTEKVGIKDGIMKLVCLLTGHRENRFWGLSDLTQRHRYSAACLQSLLFKDGFRQFCDNEGE